jgi:hypothetical protein
MLQRKPAEEEEPAMACIGTKAQLARLRNQIETCERLLLRVSDERVCQGLRDMIAIKQADAKRLLAQHKPRTCREAT